MADLPGSRAGAGGKIVTNRRRQRLAFTPYDRPPPPPPPPSSSGSPNWFTGFLIPSARAIASGAGKVLLSAIISDSESSSDDDDDDDLDSVSAEDDTDNVNEHESLHEQINASDEENLTLSEIVQHGKESQFTTQRTETKLLIERLIMKENFSREECNRLTKVLKSRVMDWSTEAGEKMSLANSPVQTVDHVDVNLSSKAVMEAKKWFQEKKGGSCSVVELANGNYNPNSTVFDHIEVEAGSPVDMARSYMKNKPPWASPKEHVELRTPLTTTTKLFKEGTPYSANHEFSSSKRRNSRTSGSWNIQEELRKVRSKAIDDMLRTPPTREQGVIGVGERISDLRSFWKTKPMDAFRDVGVSSDPTLVVLALSASESRQDGNNEDIDAIRVDGECAPSKFPYPAGPNHAVEQHPDQHSTKINGPSAEFGGRLHLNGFSTSQASLPPGDAMVQKNEQYNEENHNNDTASENRHTNTINDESNCELSSEAYVEVPIANETNSIESDTQVSLDVQYEESPMEITQPPTEGKPEAVTGKQRVGKPGRRGRGRGRGK